MGQLAQRGDEHGLRERERERAGAEDEQAPHRMRAVVEVHGAPGEKADWGVRKT
jgi:hypothetical protein